MHKYDTNRVEFYSKEDLAGPLPTLKRRKHFKKYYEVTFTILHQF